MFSPYQTIITPTHKSPAQSPVLQQGWVPFLQRERSSLPHSIYTGCVLSQFEIIINTIIYYGVSDKLC